MFAIEQQVIASDPYRNFIIAFRLKRQPILEAII